MFYSLLLSDGDLNVLVLLNALLTLLGMSTTRMEMRKFYALKGF